MAEFSMEVAVQSNMPIYFSGYGVLAGAILRSCADLRLPLVVVSLLYRKGHFDHWLDAAGVQKEAPVQWMVDKFAQPLAPVIELEIEHHTVKVPVPRVLDRRDALSDRAQWGALQHTPDVAGVRDQRVPGLTPPRRCPSGGSLRSTAPAPVARLKRWRGSSPHQVTAFARRPARS